MNNCIHKVRELCAPIRTAARLYNVSEVSLPLKLSGRVSEEAKRSGPPPLFTQEEAPFTEYLKLAALAGYGYNRHVCVLIGLIIIVYSYLKHYYTDICSSLLTFCRSITV